MHVCVTDTLVLSGVLFSLHSSECFKLYSTGQMHLILPFFHLCSNTSQQFAGVSDQFPAVGTCLCLPVAFTHPLSFFLKNSTEEKKSINCATSRLLFFWPFAFEPLCTLMHGVSRSEITDVKW